MTASRENPHQRGRPLRPTTDHTTARARPNDPRGQARPRTAQADPKPRRRSRFGGVLIVLLLGLIAVFLFWIVAEVFGAMLKLETVAVEWPEGETAIVSNEAVTLSSGLNAGDRLYAMDTAAIEAAVLRANPYLAAVEVERRLPDTVALICTPREAVYYLEVDGEWFAISTSLVVLECSDNAADFAMRGLVPLILPEVRSALVGRTLDFADDFDPSYLTALLEAHRASALWSDTDLLRVENRFDVRLIVRGSYALTLGTSEDASLKLEIGEKILADDIFGTNSGAFVDLSNPAESSVILDKQTDYTSLWRD